MRAPGGRVTVCCEPNWWEKAGVIACDILDMNPIVGVDFLQGDFRDENR